MKNGKANGNVLDLKDVVRDTTLGATGSGDEGFAGLGRALLIRADRPVSPGMILLGAGVGLPAQQLVSQGLFQKAFGLGPILSDGLTAGLSVGGHMLARSSFTLGMAFSGVAPFVAIGTQKAVSWVINGLAELIKPAQVPPVQTPGQQPQNTGMGNARLKQGAPKNVTNDIRSGARAA